MQDALRDANVLHIDFPFRGKVIVFGGDFHHMLFVIPKELNKIIFVGISSPYL